MSDTNSPGLPGAGDSGDSSWPEYLTSEGHGTGQASPASASSSAGQADPELPGGPHRVIGTPPPATARTMLPASGGDGGHAVVRELPADPPDPIRAKKAERIVVACFVLAMLAGLAFLVAYALVGVGSITKVLHSNLALGGTLALAMLLLGIGAVIWVRHLMPEVELTEQRHLMRSDAKDREAFKETFEEGAEASQFVKRPLVRRSLIAATVPLAVAPIFLLRDLGPMPGKSLDYTVWRKGLRLLVYGTGRPITPAEFSSPGGIISVGPEGYPEQ